MLITSMFILCIFCMQQQVVSNDGLVTPNNGSNVNKLEIENHGVSNRTHLQHNSMNHTYNLTHYNPAGNHVNHTHFHRQSPSLHDRAIDNNRLCKPEDYKFGQWIPGATENCGLLTSYPLNDAKDTRTNNPGVYKGYNDWCWKPLHCKSKKFNVEAFCKRLGSRRILMVGDSLQHEFYEAFTSQLNPGTKTLKQEFDLNLIRRSNIGSICNGKSRLVFIRNDQLRLKPDTKEHMHNWAEFAPQYEILVLNKGAHTVPMNVSERDSNETTNRDSLSLSLN